MLIASWLIHKFVISQIGNGIPEVKKDEKLDHTNIGQYYNNYSTIFIVNLSNILEKYHQNETLLLKNDEQLLNSSSDTNVVPPVCYVPPIC